jgi:hypothetical protein
MRVIRCLSWKTETTATAVVRRNWENVPECQADGRPSGGRPIDRRAPTK